MHRHGSIYLLVLLSTAFVTAAGLAALSLQRATSDHAEISIAVGRARLASRSAIEIALARIDEDPLWRSNVGGGVVLNEILTLGGTEVLVRATATDPLDGDLTDDVSDPVTLTVRAETGGSAREVVYELTPSSAPIGVLDLAVHAGEDSQADKSSSVAGTGTIGVVGEFNAKSVLISLDVEATTIKGKTFLGTTVAGAGPWEMPATDPIDVYAAMGVPLTDGAKSAQISDVAIGPGYNPIDADNLESKGVYVFDNGVAPVELSNMRLVGTLVFTGSGTVTVADSVLMEPAVAGYPVLLSRGSVVLSSAGTALSELALGVNLNPKGVEGVHTKDNDTLDIYPAQITGIVYSTKRIEVVAGPNVVFGHLITPADFRVSGAVLQVTHGTDSQQYPPPGFRSAENAPLVITDWAPN